MWLPRWTVDSPKGKRISCFLKYLENFFKYMAENPTVDLIIRPHPMMFQVILEKSIWTQEEYHTFMERMDKASNIYLDNNEDYLVSFGKSDVLVSDYSSLLIEYFVTGKPIIYCDTAEDFNADTLLMDATLYHAAEWYEVEMQLTELINGQDCQYEQRIDTVRQFMPSNAGHIGGISKVYFGRFSNGTGEKGILM